MLLILILQIIFFLATQFSRAESCALSCLALFYFVLWVVKAGVEGIPTKSALVSIICSRMGKKGIGKEIAKKEMEKKGWQIYPPCPRAFFRFVDLQVKVTYRKGKRGFGGRFGNHIFPRSWSCSWALHPLRSAPPRPLSDGGWNLKWIN